MTNCFFCRNDLKAYSDGETSPLRRWLIRRHLTHCASCREEINEMTQMTEDLRASEPEDTLPPALRKKLLESPLAPNNGGTRVEETETISSNPPIIGGRGASSRRFPAWTFAALAVVAWFVCYPLFRQTNESVSSIGATASYRALPQATLSLPQRASTSMSPESDDEPVSATNGIPTPAKAPPLPPKSLPALMAPRPVTAQTYEQRAASSAAASSTDTLNADPDSLRQVHKEASIGLQVPDPDATGDKLNDMVKETGGYVAANNLSTDPDGRKSGELIVKVPEPQFETFLAAVAKLGTVVSKNITGQDITETTSDAHEAQSVQESDLEQAEARLKSLGSHAKWEDQENTRDLRVQLAQTRARLTLLKRMAALGTITIDLSQTPKAAAAPPVTNGFTGTLQATTHDALQSLVGSAAALLALVIWLLAYSPIWVPLLLLGRYALKEYKKREAAQSD